MLSKFNLIEIYKALFLDFFRCQKQGKISRNKIQIKMEKKEQSDKKSKGEKIEELE